MYLLRLLFQLNIKEFERTDIGTTEELLKRLNGIVREEVIQAEHLKWIEDSLHTGKFYQASKATQNEVIDSLKLLLTTESNLKYKAQILYTKIMSSINF